MNKLKFSKSRLSIGIGFLFAIMIYSNSCTKTTDNIYDTTSNTGVKGGSGGPGTNGVLIKSMAFTPSTITVAAGTTITWTNNDSVSHTVTSDTGLFDSGSMSSTGASGSGGSYSYTFTTAGSFPYHCTIHPSMTGTVIVN